jgi:hypothetical protein
METTPQKKKISTLHTPPQLPKEKEKKKGKTSLVHVQPFHWLHKNFIPQTLDHHF